MPRKIFIIVLITRVILSLCYAEQVKENKASDTPVVKTVQIDIDNDGNTETAKATWGLGVSDKPLRIEIFKDSKIIDTINAEFGIESNYMFKDTDKDEKAELIIWSGIWDFRLPGEDGITEENYEGHSGAHRYIVATYKWLRNKYYLWDVYTTKQKYPAWSEIIPPRD